MATTWSTGNGRLADLVPKAKLHTRAVRGITTHSHGCTTQHTHGHTQAHTHTHTHTTQNARLDLLHFNLADVVLHQAVVVGDDEHRIHIYLARALRIQRVAELVVALAEAKRVERPHFVQGAARHLLRRLLTQQIGPRLTAPGLRV